MILDKIKVLKRTKQKDNNEAVESTRYCLAIIVFVRFCDSRKITSRKVIHVKEQDSRNYFFIYSTRWEPASGFIKHGINICIANQVSLWPLLYKQRFSQ